MQRPSLRQCISPLPPYVNNSISQHKSAINIITNSSNMNNCNNNDTQNISERRTEDQNVNVQYINELDEYGTRQALCKCTTHNLSNLVKTKIL